MRTLAIATLLSCTACSAADDIAVPVRSHERAAVKEPEPEPEPEPQPWPEPAHESPRFPTGAAIVEIAQESLPEPSKWRFEPGGELLAAPSDAGCDIWAIEPGVYVGRVRAAEGEPCRGWMDPTSVLGFERSERSSDDALQATIDGVAVAIVDGDGERERRLRCTGCAKVSAVAWAPSGHRLAVLRGDGRLELWDADSGRRERTLTRKLKLGVGEEIHAVQLAWGPLGIAASHVIKRRVRPRFESRHGEELPRYEYEMYDWRAHLELWSDAGEALHASDHPDDLMDFVFADPRGQWLFAVYAPAHTRAEIGWNVETHSLGQRHSAVEWSDFDYSIPDRIPEFEPLPGRWRVDATTTHLAGHVERLYSWALGLTILRVEPTPSFTSVELLRDDEDSIHVDAFEVQPFAQHGDRTVVEWSVAVGDPHHAALAGPAPGCALVDVSPDLETEVLRCGEQLRVRRAGQTVELELDPTVRVIWGRSGWLAITRYDRLIILDAAAKLVADRRGVVVLDAPLANVHDLLALRTSDDALELLDPLRNQAALRIEHVPEQVALSPDGRRVAVLTSGRIRVFGVEDGSLLARWDAPAASRLAFSQDGRYLLSGTDMPRVAWSSWTGELASGVVPKLPKGELDPSWRWLATEHGCVVRVLDGLRLCMGPDWALLDDGRFSGTPPSWLTRERHFRVGDELAVPDCTHADLEPWLRRATLIEDFFAGRAIAPAVVPEAEHDQVGCSPPVMLPGSR